MRIPEPASAALRRLLLIVLFLSGGGAAVELVLLAHYEDVWQIVPLVVLGLGLVAAAAAAGRPVPITLRTLQAVMALAVLAGLVGLALHYRGNVEFEREMYPSLTGWPLFWKAITGATPALAPGFLTQFGLLGLLYCYRHPVLPRRKE